MLDARLPRPAWIAAAGAGAAGAAALAALFALTAPPPPSRPDVRADAGVRAVSSSADARVEATPVEASGEPASSVAIVASDPSVFASVAPDELWPVVEGMPRQATLDTLAFHEPEIRRCASQSSNVDPGMPVVSLWIRMTVRGDGTVAKLETLEDSVRDETATDCIDKVLRKMHFRRAGGKNATVSMRWRF